MRSREPRDLQRPRRPVGRIAAGASLAAVGAGLLGGTIASLVGRARADAAISGLDAAIVADRREPTDAERAAVEAADRRYVRLTGAATALGIAAAVSLITGIALLAAPPRAASRARARACTGGFVYFF